VDKDILPSPNQPTCSDRKKREGTARIVPSVRW